MIPNAAKLLGVDNQRGAIRPGMAADIVATPENPLDNIQTLKKVFFVMKDGAIVRNDKPALHNGKTLKLPTQKVVVIPRSVRDEESLRSVHSHSVLTAIRATERVPHPGCGLYLQPAL